MEPKERPKPDVIQNIKRLGRKEKSTYKPSDMWTQEDDILFLKYCPSKRDRGYHMMSRDTSCRPSEILSLRIKDVVFKLAPNGRQYAEILVNGKTGQRHVPLINWLHDNTVKGSYSGFGNELLKSWPKSIRNKQAMMIYWMPLD